MGSNNTTARNLFTFDDHVYWSRGTHQVEAGAWLQRLQSNDMLAQSQYGQASFSTLQTFLQGTVKTFTVVPSPTELGWRSFLRRGLRRRHVEGDQAFRAARRVPLRIDQRMERSPRPRSQLRHRGRSSADRPGRWLVRAHRKSRQVSARATPGICVGRAGQRKNRGSRRLRDLSRPARHARLSPRPDRALQHARRPLKNIAVSKLNIDPRHGPARRVRWSRPAMCSRTSTRPPCCSGACASSRRSLRTPRSLSATSARTAITRSFPKT